MKQDSNIKDSQNILNELLIHTKNIRLGLKAEKIEDRVLMLFGDTKAGKTTLFYHIQGHKLEYFTDALGIKRMKPQSIWNNAHIGSELSSATIYPNISSINRQLTIIDMPGFNDSRQNYKLLNTYIFLETLKKIKKIHICIVIPVELLSSQQLFIFLEKTAHLLQDQFIQKQRCFSYILTKFQFDEERENFNNIIQQLKENQKASKLKILLDSFEKTNIYSFPDSPPDQRQGLQLKERIINDNNFFEINCDPMQLLSKNYDDVIIGSQYNGAFEQKMNNLALEIFINLAAFLKLLNQIFQYHYFKYLQPENISLQQIAMSIQQLKKQISINYFSQNNILITNQQAEAKLVKFIHIFKKRHLIKSDQTLSSLFDIVEALKELTKEDHSFDKDYLKNLLEYFTSLVQIFEVMSVLKSNNIKQNINAIRKSEQIDQKIKNFYQAFNLTKLFKNKQFAKLYANEQVKLIIDQFDPNIIQKLQGIDDEQNFEYIQQTVSPNFMIKWSKNFDQTVSYCKTSKKGQQIIQKKLTSYKKPLTEAQLEKMQNNSQSLQYLLSQLKNRQKDQKIEQKKLLQKMLKKISIIFEKVSLFQNAILINMSIPDEIEIEKLTLESFKFNYLQQQFLKMVLVPYFVVNCNILMVEKCCNYLSSLSYSLQKYKESQIFYNNSIQDIRSKMKSYAQSIFQNVKRFNFYYLDNLINNRQQIVEKVKKCEYNWEKSLIKKVYIELSQRSKKIK